MGLNGNTYIHRNITPTNPILSMPAVLSVIWFNINDLPDTDAKDIEIYRMALYEIEDDTIINTITDQFFYDPWDDNYDNLQEILLDTGFEILWNDNVIDIYVNWL